MDPSRTVMGEFARLPNGPVRSLRRLLSTGSLRNASSEALPAVLDAGNRAVTITCTV